MTPMQALLTALKNDLNGQKKLAAKRQNNLNLPQAWPLVVSLTAP
jgi:hypothetical protein